MNLLDMPENKNELRASVERMKRHKPDMVELIGLVAALKFEAYTKFMAAGFSEQQALELCKVSVITV